MALAAARNLTLATAESCTAGALVHHLSNVPGAAEHLHGSFVVYTKENKIAALGVPKNLIDKHSAVSAEVAVAMAQGALERCPATLVASITGVAGPEPDEDGNPVGLVFVAVAARDGTVRVKRHDFGEQAKHAVCAAASAAALALLIESVAR